MNKEEGYVLAFCWFDEEQWKLLAEIDPAGVDASYQQWRKNANSVFLGMKAKDAKVIKISIKISRLKEWCKEKGIEPDSDARSEYVLMLAQREGRKS